MPFATGIFKIAWESTQYGPSYGLENLVRQQPGIYKVERDHREGMLKVLYDENRTDLNAVIDWVSRYGHIIRIPESEEMPYERD